MQATGTASEAVTSTIIIGTASITATFAKNTVKVGQDCILLAGFQPDLSQLNF